MLLEENPIRGVCEFLMRATTDIMIGNTTTLQLYPGVGEIGTSGFGRITSETHIGGVKSVSAQDLAEKCSPSPYI